jgi:hypothetical protein
MKNHSPEGHILVDRQVRRCKEEEEEEKKKH